MTRFQDAQISPFIISSSYSNEEGCVGLCLPLPWHPSVLAITPWLADSFEGILTPPLESCLKEHRTFWWCCKGICFHGGGGAPGAAGSIPETGTIKGIKLSSTMLWFVFKPKQTFREHAYKTCKLPQCASLVWIIIDEWQGNYSLLKGGCPALIESMFHPCLRTSMTFSEAHYAV